MNLRSYIALFVTLVFAYTVCAGEKGGGVSNYEIADPTAKTQRFYDSLESKTSRRKVPNLIYNSLFVKTKKDTLQGVSVVDETKDYKAFEGKIIDSIIVVRSNVFEDGGSKLERFANNVHVVTRDRVVRRDLFFKHGDRLEAQKMVNNEQFLKGRSYIYDADLRVRLNPTDTTRVTVEIRTQDSWTLSADAGLNFGGRSMIELYDANLFGWGNRLSVRTNFDWTKGEYGGNKVEYEIPNIMGTFFRGEFVAGKNFEHTDLGFTVKKEFIQPTDYEVGLSYMNSNTPYYMLYADSSVNVDSKKIDAWGGKSWLIKSIGSSIYLTGSYNSVMFDSRPEVSVNFNPAFHNGDQVLMGLGLYREKFYATNLIYGYGVKEYIPSGYRAELTAGYRWGEFSNDYYLGAEYSAGRFTKIGYLMGGLSIGSYYNTDSRELLQSALNFRIRYFSNLIPSGRSRIRQFVTINYMRGWNRLGGSDELITFDKRQDLRGFNDYAVGVNRALLSSETVVFTPLQPLGFRMTFFGYADLGLLGNNVNMFKNTFFSTFGVGVRLKNERLVFTTIQLRLGIAVGKAGMLKSDVFNISNQYDMEKYRYLPKRPETIPYR